jgi:hypothetical protein
MEVDGTYDTFSKVPVQGATAASAQIVLSQGFIQPAAKKTEPVHRRPTPAHHPGM